MTHERALALLSAAFEGPERAGLRLTERGIWLATPVPVLWQAVEAGRARDLFRPSEGPLRVLDAGSGDGRLLAVLAARLGVSRVELCGIECDGALLRRSEAALAGLRARGLFDGGLPPRVVGGDYFEPGPYEQLAVPLAGFDLVWHYPDGNEERLQDRIAESAPATRLALLSPDRNLRPRLRTEWQIEVEPGGGEPPWLLSVLRG